MNYLQCDQVCLQFYKPFQSAPTNTICKRIPVKRKLHFKKLLTEERKLIQEREEEREQKLEVGENRGHSPGSLQHSLDKHLSLKKLNFLP